MHDLAPMNRLYRLLLLILCLVCCCATGLRAESAASDFPAWLDQLRNDARAAGISQATLERALGDLVEPQPRVIELDRRQPEQVETVANYLATRVTPQRIATGRKLLRRYATWLDRIERRYGVQKRFIVALWGIESNYGEQTGQRPVIHSLVTLAYDERRGDYFRKELLEALRIVDSGSIPLSQLKGSWAGAMGPFQFMPSSYRHYAVDADGDGRIDIWGSVPDALASAANYLDQAGWQHDRTWGRKVKLPKKFDPALAGLNNRLPLSRWQALGVRRSNGRALPRGDLKAALILPDGPGEAAYLVYDNFRALRAWNRSNAFALAIGTLADELNR